MLSTGRGRREGRDYPPDVLLPGPHQLAVPEAKTLGGEMARAILRGAKGIWRKSSPSCQTVVFLPFGSSIPASLGRPGLMWRMMHPPSLSVCLRCMPANSTDCEPGIRLSLLSTQQNVHDLHAHIDPGNLALRSAALAALNGREVLGSELKVTWNVQAGGTKEDTTNHPTVFVGNIGDQIDEYALFEAFSAYNCSDSRIIRGDDGRCLGYGFITIRTQEDAKAAVAAMDGQRLMGRPLRVSFAKTPRLSEADGLQAGGGGAGGATGIPASTKSRGPDVIITDVGEVSRMSSETNTTVHVGNLLGTETEETLRASFQEFGEIDNLRVPGKNFGFVQYKDHISVRCARVSDW